MLRLAILCLLGVLSVQAYRDYVFVRGRAKVNKPLKADGHCQRIDLDPYTFNPDEPIYVQLTVTYGNTNNVVNHATASWVEKVTINGFLACVMIAGRTEGPASGSVHVDWLAYQGMPEGGQIGQEQIVDEWWTGTTCKKIILNKEFAKVPRILVTAEHTHENNMHDAASIWVEDPDKDSFKVCFRELQNFDGIHKNIKINWMAFLDAYLPMFKEHGSVVFENENLPTAANNFAYCKEVPLTRAYTDQPTIIVTASHTTSTGSLNPSHNGITAWVEFVSKSKFRVCVKELYVTKHDPLTVGYAVQSQICSPGWAYHDGFCYLPVDNCKKWAESKTDCSNRGAQLSHALYHEENEFIQNLHKGAESWISFNDISKEGHYEWADGSSVNFTFWNRGEPRNDNSNDCIVTSGTDRCYRWKEIACGSCKAYTCKRDFDECGTGFHNCDPNADCENENGKFECKCRDGFYGNGVECHKNRNFETSAIFNGNVNFLRSLNQWLDERSPRDSEWKRCLHAKTDGWDSKTFHDRCDYKGPTVTIIRKGTYVFGGYTGEPWEGRRNPASYRLSPGAFVFTLENHYNKPPAKFEVYKNAGNGIYNNYGYGPTFGGGHDFHIANAAGSNTNSYSDLGHTYSNPYGYSYKSNEARSFLAGGYKFQPNDMEVFYEPRDAGDLSVSSILQGNEEATTFIMGMLGTHSNKDAEWIKCWESKKDGSAAATFHKNCDDKGATITLISAGNRIFGGFSDIYWRSTNGYRRSDRTFLFGGDGNGVFTSRQYKNDQNAIYDHSGYGPTFGGGHDLYIVNNAHHSTSSYTNLGHTYQPPTGYGYGSSSTKKLLAGSYNFKPSNIEVFYRKRNDGGFDTSPILNQNKDYIAKLNEWLGHTNWKRCHSTRHDGPSSRTFHGNCDKRGPTVTIVRVGEYIFGGYASETLTSRNSYINTGNSFLFSLHNKVGKGPMKLKYYRNSGNAIYDHYNYGPTFGGGHDLYITNDGLTGYASVGHTYLPPTGFTYGQANARTFLAGVQNFRVSEYEVFYKA